MRQLGFDSGFDLSLECKVDAMEAQEVQLGRRYHFALQRLEAQKRRVSLPCACVQVSKAMASQDDGGKSAKKPDARTSDLSIEEAMSNLADRVAEAAAVPPEAVLVQVVDAQLQCTVQISCLGASVLGTGDALAAKKKESGGKENGDPFGIHKAFAEAGAVDDLKMTVSPVWATERVIEEVKRIHPDYLLEEATLNSIIQAAVDSQAEYNASWQEITREEKDVVSVLLSYASMSSFVAAGQPKVMSIEEATAKGLMREPLKQESNDLRALAEAASQAHMQLKQVLAPGTAWAQDFLCDLGEVPYEDERRRTIAGSSNRLDVVPGALIIDLGLKAERHLFEKAKWKQRPEQMTPPLQDVLDVSRLLIVFKNCTELCAGLDRLMQSLDVVSLENRFLNPLCMGHRCIMLRVRQNLGSLTYISKLILEHQQIFDIKEHVGAHHFKRVRSQLSTLGVASKTSDNLQRIVLRELGSTKAQSIQVQEQELLLALECAKDASTVVEPDGAALAMQIINQSVELALAAGVPQTRVTAATARAAASMTP